MNPQGMLGLERPYLRARRRVRQRVDAGEPRNSYSSIPGFSFRTNAGCGPNVSTTPPINPAVSSPHHPFLAAAAVRMNGFPHDPRSPHPGFPHPPHPMMGPGGPFFRPPFLPGGPPGDFPGAPGMIPPHGAPFMGHPGRPPFGPRPFFMHQQQLQQQQQQQQQHQQNCHVPPSVVNPVTSFHSGVVGDIRAGMAAAACAAAAAVQRAQILMQAKTTTSTKSPIIEDSSNGESRRDSPFNVTSAESESDCNVGDGATSKKDLSSRTKTENDLSGNVGDEATSTSVARSPADLAAAGVVESNQESSLVESLSKEQQVSANSENQKVKDFSNVLKEIIQGKLALAAVATVASRHSNNNQELDMEQLAARAGDFASARHNNNDLKDQNPGAALMSQILKMRQEMALNMSLQQQKLESEAQRSSSPNSPKMEPMEDLDDEEEELPIDLQRNSEDERNSERSQNSPRSPSSDAGMSTSSAGGKADKASRLEHIVSSINRASPSLPKEASGMPVNAPVNGCKKRKLYQPVQAKSTEDSESSAPEVKKVRENESNESNDENEAPKINGSNPVNGNPPNALQLQYMEMMARKFFQDQQDKATKEALTKEILAETVGKNHEIEKSLTAISPELKGVADVLKAEITASLGPLIDTILGRFMQGQRNNNSMPKASLGLNKPGFLPGSLGMTGLSGSDPVDPMLPPMPSLKTNTPSGRAPQVRDRAAPRSNGGMMPVSMYNPTKFMPPVTTSTTSSNAFPLPPTLRPAPGLLQPGITTLAPSTTSTTNTSLNNNNSEDEGSAPSPGGNNPRELSPPEQDEALSLVVTPKKRRHKVTDTRITPRTLSRVLGEQPLAELHKQFPHFAAGLKADGNLPRPQHPLFPGLPGHPGLLSGLPTSVAIPNPSLSDFNPFSFYSPPHLPSSTATGATPPGMPAVRDNKPKMMMSATPPLEKSKPQFQSRERHHSSSDLGARDDATPPSLLRHPSLLSRGSPDFAARLREDRDRDIEDFDRMAPFFGAGFSPMGGEATSATLTPMHLRKAKLMFFWVRYPSSAILKMYFPDIKFNKNNTAQLVKWFSNFREFFYIQMEKYARQALSEGVKSDTELHVSEESELYRVLNVHYNRNNHIEIPEHFLPVVKIAFCEFFNAIQHGKDAESSWKKQIYKIIQRYDEPIPEYFKTPEFLKQLE